MQRLQSSEGLSTRSTEISRMDEFAAIMVRSTRTGRKGSSCAKEPRFVSRSRCVCLREEAVMCASGIKGASETSGLMIRRRLTEIKRIPARGSISLGLAGRNTAIDPASAWMPWSVAARSFGAGRERGNRNLAARGATFVQRCGCIGLQSSVRATKG